MSGIKKTCKTGSLELRDATVKFINRQQLGDFLCCTISGMNGKLLTEYTFDTEIGGGLNASASTRSLGWIEHLVFAESLKLMTLELLGVCAKFSGVSACKQGRLHSKKFCFNLIRLPSAMGSTVRCKKSVYE